MKAINRKVAGALVLAITGGGLFLGAGSATAAGATPAWEPDANSADYGTLSFYDASGNQVSSGNNLSRLFDYAVASTASQRATTKATLFFGFPDHTKADTITWYSSQAGAASSFPIANAPGDVANAGNKPVNKVGAGEANLSAALGGADLDQTPGFKDIVQIRLRDSGPGKPVQPGFWGADIQFNQANNSWTQVYPAVASATSTAIASVPNSTQGDTVPLKATVTKTADGSPITSGTVQFKDGANPIGSPVTPNASGVATSSTNTLAVGPHTLSATYTPADPTVFKGSTSSTTTNVAAPATPTTVAASVTGGYTSAGQAASLAADVSASNGTPTGTVAFYDNGAASPIPGTVSNSGTHYTLDVPNGFAAGQHSIVAKFTPADPSAFAPSQSQGQAFVTDPAGACADPASACTDPQPIKATVPVGTLVINTPYTAASPLDLGNLALSADSSKFVGSKTFSNIVVTDTRSGNQPWTAAALSGSLTNGKGGSINGQNVGLTGLQVQKGTGFTGTVVTSDNAVPAAPVAATDPGSAGLGGAVPHTIATADHGQGSVTMNGTLTVEAPSSTQQGVYAGTVTFTVG